MKILMALLAAVTLFFLQKFLYRRIWRKSLAVDLNFSDEKVIEGEECELLETVSNKKMFLLPIIRVKFIAPKYFTFLDTSYTKITDHNYRNDILSVSMYQKLTRSLPFRCSHRGYYYINNIDVVCSDLFITTRSVANYAVDTHLYVYPKLVDSDQFHIQFKKMLGAVLTKRFINEDPFEFRNIREYQPYDELKLINWKASAKTDSLKVNVKDYTASQQIKILINLESDKYRVFENIQEESIRVAATFASAFIDQGIPAAVFANASDVMTNEIVNIPAGCGSNHMNVILQSLAKIDTSQEIPAFVPIFQKELSKFSDNDFIVVISSYQKEDLQLLFSYLHQNQTDFMWIIPFQSDEKLTINEELMPYSIPWKM